MSTLDGPKQGFQLPVARWLRTDLAPFAREVLLDRRAPTAAGSRPAEVERLIDQHVAGPADHGHKLWSLLVLELWAQSLTPAGAGSCRSPPEKKEPCAGARSLTVRETSLIDPIS